MIVSAASLSKKQPALPALPAPVGEQFGLCASAGITGIAPRCDVVPDLVDTPRD